MDPITIVVLGGLGVLTYFLVRPKPASQSGATMNDVCTSCPSSLTGTSAQLLTTSSSPAGGYPPREIKPPAPYKPILFSQQRVRPDGPMLIYPVSNVGQGTVSQTRSANRIRITKSQP